MFSQLLTAAVLAFSAHVASAASCSRSYRIQAGDYCDKISAAQNVSTFQLAAVNSGIINSGCTNLMPDTDLCLGHAGEDCTTTYVVKSGDSCSAISSGAGTNSTILLLNNPQIDPECANIYVGEVLCIKTDVTVPPIPATGVVVPVSGPPAQAPDAGAAATPAPTAITVTPTAAAPTTAAPAATPTPPPAADDDDDCSDDSDDTGDDSTPADSADDGDCDADTGDDADDGSSEDDSDLPFCDEL